ncbi:hypothetical protein [Streptomyces sp. 142MFCol3.1]|uniref:hypothetical protein n=1 Tax=Streptomyces sp. 142MFCol3.1 TaxID=1172179 RepID=UPI00040F20CD|nr:hypothetical protein [Streptomyces sp. 142MFCol3.1]
MFADYTPADDRLVPLVGQIMAEYPADSIDFFYEEVLNPLSIGYFASLTLGNDGRLAETALDGPGVTALYETLGPTLRETSRPEDDRPLWGGP